MTAERLAQVVRVLNSLKVQLILITGDFVTRLLASSAATLSQLQYLQAPDGVFATLGNHDHWAGQQQVTTILQANGIHVLKDTLHTLDRGSRKAVLHLVGMDDLWTDEPTQSAWAHEGRLERLLRQVPVEGAALLMVHEPDFADVAAPQVVSTCSSPVIRMVDRFVFLFTALCICLSWHVNIRQACII